MSLEAIKQVTDAERTAKDRLTEAQAEAKRQIAAANADGEAELLARRAEADAAVKKLMADAELKAAENSTELLEKTNQECSHLRAKAEGRLEDAASLIVGRIVNG